MILIFFVFLSKTIERIQYLLDKRKNEMIKNLKLGDTFKIWILRLEVKIKGTLEFTDKKTVRRRSHVFSFPQNS